MSGIARDEQPLDGDAAAGEKAGRPPYAADDGKSGGNTGGQVHAGNGSHTDGDNAQRGGPSGSETDASAPGMASHKKSDDAK